MRLINDADALVGYSSEFRFTHGRHGLTEVVDAKQPHQTQFKNKSGDIAAIKTTDKDGSSVVIETGLYPDMISEYRYNAQGERHGKSMEGFSYTYGNGEYNDQRPVHYWNGKHVGEMGYLFQKAQKTLFGRMVTKAVHHLFKKNMNVMFEKEKSVPAATASTQHYTA